MSVSFLKSQWQISKPDLHVLSKDMLLLRTGDANSNKVAILINNKNMTLLLFSVTKRANTDNRHSQFKKMINLIQFLFQIRLNMIQQDVYFLTNTFF